MPVLRPADAPKAVIPGASADKPEHTETTALSSFLGDTEQAATPYTFDQVLFGRFRAFTRACESRNYNETGFDFGLSEPRR